MAASPYNSWQIDMRADLAPALDRAWQQIGQTGEWLTGAQRVAIATEARNAWNCTLCQKRKDALSPNSVTGDHDHNNDLPDDWVDVIHRVATDSGRLTESWYQQALSTGIAEDEYIEIVSVCIIMTTMDAFTYGVGMPLAALPEPVDGTPARQRDTTATPGPGWVSTIAPENADSSFEDFYAGESYFYIRRSLTLVPGEVRRFWDLMNPLYLDDPRIHELDGVDRDISRGQMEFLAARASMLLGCYY